MSDIPVSVREHVRQRADGRCEYCHKPEEFSTVTFQIDHIIAKKHEGSSELDNLAFACFKCNNSKGADVASYDSITRELTPLFNPRTQIWDEHFSVTMNGVISGLTPIGRITTKLLQMNHPKQIEIRRLLIEADLW